MKYSLPNIINIPPLIFQIYNTENLSSIKKILIILLGKVSQIVIKYFDGKLFCIFMNLIFRKHSKIDYDNSLNLYSKKLDDKLSISYPNKRIMRVIQKDKVLIFEKLYKTYCLDQIKFEDSDLIIDCGANVGELNYSFYYKNIFINYMSFEPDKDSYDCLKINKIRKSDKMNNFALSNKNGEAELYVDGFGGNSSLEYFGDDKSITIQTKTLDSLNIENQIKLFKVEAEGHEPEVLEGSLNTLKNIEYIAVDFGFERGLNQENTINSVNNILTKNNFELKNISEYRLVGLYKNLKLT